MSNEYEVFGKIMLAEDRKYNISVLAHFDREDIDNVSINFLHVMTNQPCERVEQVLEGWSEEDEESQSKWNELVRRLNENLDILLHMEDEEEDCSFIIYENGMLERVS